MSGDCKFTQIPEVLFLVNYGGITVFSERFTNPKLVPFDICGRCRNCKSDNVTIDYAIQNEGVTVMTDRMKKPKFVPFDVVKPFENECFFRVKTQSRSLDIPYRVETTAINSAETAIGSQFTRQYSVPSDLVVNRQSCKHHDVSMVPAESTTNDNMDGREEFVEVVMETGSVNNQNDNADPTENNIDNSVV